MHHEIIGSILRVCSLTLSGVFHMAHRISHGEEGPPGDAGGTVNGGSRAGVLSGEEPEALIDRRTVAEPGSASSAPDDAVLLGYTCQDHPGALFVQHTVAQPGADNELLEELGTDEADYKEALEETEVLPDHFASAVALEKEGTPGSASAQECLGLDILYTRTAVGPGWLTQLRYLAMANADKDSGRRICFDGMNLNLRLCGLTADWENQKLRLAVPCSGTRDCEWRRKGIVVTLGELFLILRHKWIPAQIYYFYRILSLLAIKRHMNLLQDLSPH